jgi:hypothetical protein
MSINMMGHVSAPFITHRPQLVRFAETISDFETVYAQVYSDEFDANIQIASDREIEFLTQGGERINDVRIVHRNDGKGIEISTPDKLADILIFSVNPGVDEPIWWKAIQVDYRPWHNFCRAAVVRVDPAAQAKIMAKVTP